MGNGENIERHLMRLRKPATKETRIWSVQTRVEENLGDPMRKHEKEKKKKTGKSYDGAKGGAF